MYRVVIADDEPLVRTGLFHRINWTEMGYEVVGLLEDGSDVLKLLENQRVDVLLTDICMYEVSGLDVARVIKSKYPWMKVILLSGYREFEYAREAMRCDVREYLLKPIDYEVLRRELATIRAELDEESHEELLLQSLGEEAYAQVLKAIKTVTSSALGEGEEGWLAYARLKPLLNDLPGGVREIVVKRLLEYLQSELVRKDRDVAEEFSKRLQSVKLEEDGGVNQQPLIDLFCDLNDELMSRNIRNSSSAVVDNSIARACAYISSHLGEDFTYRDVAEFVFISPRHFIRRFRSEMNETFTDYVLRQRIEGAARLLEGQEIELHDIAAAVGYKDEKYFQKIFKDHMGCTMKEYRARSARGQGK